MAKFTQEHPGEIDLTPEPLTKESPANLDPLAKNKQTEPQKFTNPENENKN